MIKSLLVTTVIGGFSSVCLAGTFSIDPPEILNGALAVGDGGFAALPPSYPLDFQYGANKLAQAWANAGDGYTPLVTCWVRWKVKWLQSGSETAPSSGILYVQKWGHSLATAFAVSYVSQGIASGHSEINDLFLPYRNVGVSLEGVNQIGISATDGNSTDATIGTDLNPGVTFTQKTQHQWAGWAYAEIGLGCYVSASASSSPPNYVGAKATVDAFCQLHPLRIETGVGNATFQSPLS